MLVAVEKLRQTGSSHTNFRADIRASSGWCGRFRFWKIFQFLIELCVQLADCQVYVAFIELNLASSILYMEKVDPFT